jgi:hypothetical protein
MRRRQAVPRWVLLGLGALLLLLGAYGIVRIAVVWHLVKSLAR